MNLQNILYYIELRFTFFNLHYIKYIFYMDKNIYLYRL